MKTIPIPSLENTGLVKTACTLLGEGVWTYGNPQSKQSFEQLAITLNVDLHHMVRVNQKHTALVHAATAADAGCGIYLPHLEEDSCEMDLLKIPSLQNDAPFDFSLDSGIDGLVTNVRGLTLCTTQADCVPVFLLDPVSKAIGMIHSGWRGTAARISARAVALMKAKYGSEPQNILAALGPCICGSCYEVGSELINPFEAYFPANQIDEFFTPQPAGKYLLNVPLAVKHALTDAGVREQNITMPAECTYHDAHFSSYRRDRNAQDRMLTAIVLV